MEKWRLSRAQAQALDKQLLRCLLHMAHLVLVARREQPLKLIVEDIRDGGGDAVAVAGDVKEARTH